MFFLEEYQTQQEHRLLYQLTQFPPPWTSILLSSMKIRANHLLQEAFPDSLLPSSGDGQVPPGAQLPFITTDLGNAHTRAGQRWADRWAGDHGQVCAAHQCHDRVWEQWSHENPDSRSFKQNLPIFKEILVSEKKRSATQNQYNRAPVCNLCLGQPFSTCSSILLIYALLKKKVIIYLFLAVLGLCCYAGFFFSCSKLELGSSWGVQASYCSGFSCFRARAPGHVGLSSCKIWSCWGSWAQ